jgi:glycosidase
VRLGKMDYLYDKVDFYDRMKAVMQGKSDTTPLMETQAKFADIEHHLLHFLENHDEQRIASPEFAGDARKGLPAMVVSATISTSPTLLYFGQDVGEKGEGNAGFGKASRTTIFDYWGVPAHQRWMNAGAFDGGQSTPEEKLLRTYYTQLMSFTRNAPALMGMYRELHTVNLNSTGYDGKVFAFARWSPDQQVLVASNFSADKSKSFDLKLSSLIADWGLSQGMHEFRDVFTGATYTVIVSGKSAATSLNLAPLQSVILVRNP